MSTTLFYVLGLAALPVGTLLVTRFVGWSLERELRRGRQEQLKREGSAFS